MNKNLKIQAIIGAILSVLMLVWAYSVDKKLALYLVSGLLIGYVLTRSRFGYAGGVKKVYMTGNYSLTRTLFIMFVITAIVVAGIHFNGVMHGKSFAELPGFSSVRPLDMGTIIGGLLFGGGMIFAGGCASGTLTDLGEGAVRALIALIFYIVGAPIGHYLRVIYDKSDFKLISVKVYFPEYLGFIGAVLLTAGLFLFLYFLVYTYSQKRKRENTFIPDEYEEIEKPVKEDPNASFFSYQTYHKLFIERWSFLTGALIISLLFILVLVSTGKSWGVTSAFTSAGVWIFSHLGIDFGAIGGFEKEIKAAHNLLADPGTVRNIGIVFGALICFLLAGRFKVDTAFRFKDASLYAAGGLMMGIGARFAKGCNVGALYSAITNFSLHGWGFLVAMTIGGIIILKMFEGKLNIIPNRKKKGDK